MYDGTGKNSKDSYYQLSQHSTWLLVWDGTAANLVIWYFSLPGKLANPSHDSHLRPPGAKDATAPACLVMNGRDNISPEKSS